MSLPANTILPSKDKKKSFKFAMAGWILLASLNCGLSLGTVRLSTGLDFSAPYTAVKIYREYPHERLYDRELIIELERSLPGQPITLYYHPPYELTFWMLVASLPFATALWVWRGVSVVMLALASFLLWRSIGRSRGFWLTFISAAAFFPVAFCLLQGQDSILLLVVLSATLYLLQKNRDALAGAVLAVGLFKPQLVLPIAAVFLLWRQWRFLLGFTGSALAVLFWNFVMVGYAGLRSMVYMLMGVEPMHTLGAKIEYMANLRALFYLFMRHKPHLLSVTVLIVSALLMIWAVRSSRLGRAQSFAILICFAVLVSYHAHQYDLTILIIPIAMAIGNRVWENREGWIAVIPIILLFQSWLYLIAGAFAVGGLLSLLILWLWYGLERNFKISTERWP